VVGLFNDVSQILPRPTLVAMATNFEPKLAITRRVSDIYPRYLRLAKVFRAELLNDDSSTKFVGFGRKLEIMREEYIRLVTV